MIYFVENGIYQHQGINSCSKQDCLDILLTKTIVGFDIETTDKFKNKALNTSNYKPGLDPYLSDIIMVQIGDEEHSFVIDCRNTNPTFLEPVLTSRKIRKVGHYLKFEAKHIRHNYGIAMEYVWDTMLAHQNLYLGTTSSLSLEALGQYYLNLQNTDKIDLFNQERDDDDNALIELEQGMLNKNTRMGFLHMRDEPFTVGQIKYGVDDLYIPLAIQRIQVQGRKVGGEIYNPSLLHEIEFEATLAYADMELPGMPVDSEMWMELYKENLELYRHRLDKLNNYVTTTYPAFANQLTLFGGNTCLVDWSSPQQTVNFFKQTGTCPKEKSKQTGKLEFTVSAKAMTKLLPASLKTAYAKNKDLDIEGPQTLILAYLLLKRAEQACTTFGESWIKEYTHPITGRVHSQYRQILNSGRTSSSNPNLQNVPRDERYRACFRSGKNILSADYSGQELRVTAHKSQDKGMLDFFNIGNETFGSDFHSYVATSMFRIMWDDPELVITAETHPKERNAAKSLNFKIIYGGSAYSLKYDFDVDEDEAQEFIDNYYATLPGLKQYFDVVEEETLRRGYIVIDPITDRRWFFRNYSKYSLDYDKLLRILPDRYDDLSDDAQRRIRYKLNGEVPEFKKLFRELEQIEGSLRRKARNYPIQGTAALMKKIAICYIRRWYNAKGLWGKVFPINEVHDEYLGESGDDYAEQFRGIIQSAMEKAGQYMCGSVKITADCHIDKYWKH